MILPYIADPGLRLLELRYPSAVNLFLTDLWGETQHRLFTLSLVSLNILNAAMLHSFYFTVSNLRTEKVLRIHCKLVLPHGAQNIVFECLACRTSRLAGSNRDEIHQCEARPRARTATTSAKRETKIGLNKTTKGYPGPRGFFLIFLFSWFFSAWESF